MVIRRVHGYSMLPALTPGQLVLARSPRRLKEGDVVIFKHQGLEKIKRLHAVKDRQVQVRGDNKKHSTDSRDFGWLPLSAITGRVIWPKV